MTDMWIPIDESVPADDSFVLVSFANAPIPAIGQYVEDGDGGGNMLDDEGFPYLRVGLIPNAWMPLPECYKED